MNMIEVPLDFPTCQPVMAGNFFGRSGKRAHENFWISGILDNAPREIQ
jgi:hypothetical protein